MGLAALSAEFEHSQMAGAREFATNYSPQLREAIIAFCGVLNRIDPNSAARFRQHFEPLISQNQLDLISQALAPLMGDAVDDMIDLYSEGANTDDFEGLADTGCFEGLVDDLELLNHLFLNQLPDYLHSEAHRLVQSCLEHLDREICLSRGDIGIFSFDTLDTFVFRPDARAHEDKSQKIAQLEALKNALHVIDGRFKTGIVMGSFPWRGA